MALFESMTALLPRRLQPYAKSFFPLLATIVAAVGSWVSTGVFDDAEIRTSVVGLVAALLAHGPPNNPAAALPSADPDHLQ